ncbi:SGNH/GDSL hydrolase family protein [Agrobacterium tumefaciens]|uniref:SGNH/GDSL hydrolase family protein n=1 Tax=Agrobacterium tumefaciens TaxID=358 RepID=UPI0012965501|nr:SGNH/GDSL hydrolase family protein [Agrobacterium tumefaciens]MQB37577.1 SGNH/GDSL hydrolase family protein [Agrobacterium tumefaciens]
MIGLGLGLSLGVSGKPGKSLRAFSPLKTKLEAGQDAVLFVNGDSTSYSDYGPYYKFAVALGDLHDYTVVMNRWAEWDNVAGTATGPKQYASSATLRTGTRGTLTVFLAALPGQVAGCMFDGTRKPNAIDAIPTPDLCIIHHGHNMQSFNIPSGTSNYATGVGLFLGPIGMTELQWPNVPQLITTQNPWRDDNGYNKVYQAILLAYAGHSTMTLIDTYAQFIARGKASSLYRDNVHPSDTSGNSAGAQLISDTLFSAYQSSKPAVYTTPAWPLISATNLIDNGDFATWTEPSPPTGWALQGSGTACAKDTTTKYGAAAYSMALTPSTSIVGQNTFLQKYLSSTEMGRIAGKTVTVAMLVRGRSTQPRAYASFGVPDFSNAIKTYVMGDLLNCKDGWMWLVASGIPVVNDAAATWKYLRIYPAFDVTNPTNTDPINIQKVLITDGISPKGIIA